MQVFWCWPFSYATGSIVVRSVAGAEPAAKVSGPVAKRHAAKVRTYTDHDQKSVMSGHNPIGIRSSILANQVGVSSACIRQVAEVLRTRLIDFLLGPMANEYGLSRQHDRKLGTGFNTGHINPNTRQSEDIRRWVHLID
ncbi:hypothetical protein AN189_14170 [Loktanella sp. 3ANDIMAR09]|nr:hypothetical protein AN189_14170 [Loktanella sp. 3ANDIMAR09]